MSKNLRTIIILLVVLALCIGLFVALTMFNKNNEAEEEAEAEASIVNIGNIVDGLYIGITTNAGSMEFISDGESWMYYQDQSFPLEESYMTDIVDAAVGLTAVREIEVADDLSYYGLDEGSYLSLRIIDSENNIFALDIGSPIGDGSTWYARDPDLNTIYVISSELPTAVDFDLYDMIEPESFGSFETSDIKSMTITSGEQQLVYQQEVDTETVATGEFDEDTGEEIYMDNVISTWYDVSSGEAVIMEDSTVPASLAEIAAAFEFASCKNYNASEDYLDTAGLLSPETSVTVVWTDISGEEVSQTLLIGRTDDEGNYWVKLSDSNTVYMMESIYIESFLVAVTSLTVSE